VVRSGHMGGPSMPPPPTRGVRQVPLGWLALAVAAAGGSAALILTGSPRWAGLTIIIGVLVLLQTQATARMQRKRRAVLAAWIVDRVHDASVLAPLAWVARGEDDRIAVLAIVALGTAFVAAYERARGASLGFRVREPGGYRAVLSLILGVGLLGGWIQGALWGFVAVTAAAGAVRAWTVWGQYRRVHAGPMTSP
jgi:hypothetical protein